MPASWAGALTHEWQLIARRAARSASALRPHRVAEPPPGHGVGLAPPVEQDDAVRDLGIGEERGVLAAVVDDPRVDLVAQHGHPGMLREPRRELVDLTLRHRPAGRIGRGVENDEAGRRSDAREHRLGVEGVVLALQQRDRNRLRTAELDHRLVDGKAGVGVHDLGARLPEHEDGEEHRHLAPRHDDDARGVHLHAAPRREVRGHRFAELRDAGGGGVAVVAVAKRPHRRLHDVGRSLEVRLSDAEVDDVAPAACELLGARQHLERGLGAELTHPIAWPQHAYLPLASSAHFPVAILPRLPRHRLRY